MTATPVTHITAILSTLTESRKHLRDTRRALSGVLLSHGWVAGFDNGLYVAVDTDEVGTVTKVRAVGVLLASRLTKADAQQITRDGNLKNGAGECARALPLVEALDNELRALDAHIELVEARLDEALGITTTTTN